VPRLVQRARAGEYGTIARAPRQAVPNLTPAPEDHSQILEQPWAANQSATGAVPEGFTIPDYLFKDPGEKPLKKLRDN